MAGKPSENKSKRDLEGLWKKALQNGECPFGGCNLSDNTCEHLDGYLSYIENPHLNYVRKSEGEQKGLPKRKVRTLYTSDIDDYAVTEETTSGVWELFKKLKKYGLARDQIGVVLRRACLEMNFRQIAEDMNWTHPQYAFRRYQEAIKTLRTRGYK